MSPPTELLEPLRDQQRTIGRIRARRPGPTMIVMTGMHGNELAGELSARRVLESLGSDGLGAGELVILRGNLNALEKRVRFVDDDLNRQWTPNTVARLRATNDGPAGTGQAEDNERRALLGVLGAVVAEARGQVYFLDLHTSSADGAPFLTVGDTLRNRKFAQAFPLPLILGLEEQVDGSLLEYLNNFGLVTLGAEAGQHDSVESVARHEAVLRLALVHAGLIDREAAADLDGFARLLESAGSGIPQVLEVRYRHVLHDGDGFRMDPGFVNFQPIRAGQRLAEDHKGHEYAKESGRLLLPLYQGKGDDGFFIAREFRPFWLAVSAAVRRLGLANLLRFLPGVRIHPEHADVLLVNTRLARVYPLEIFHLLGYRKLRRIGAALAVSRRRYDLNAPRTTTFK